MKSLATEDPANRPCGACYWFFRLLISKGTQMAEQLTIRGLLLRYGKGTQWAMISGESKSKRHWLINRFNRSGGNFEGQTKIRKDDPRILSTHDDISQQISDMRRDAEATSASWAVKQGRLPRTQRQVFTAITEPYGFVTFDAYLREVEVDNYVPNQGFEGKRKALLAEGIILKSHWCGALCCGVPMTDDVHSRYPVGQPFSVEVSQQQWDRGEKRTVAM